jgi:hypothetical protein
MYRDSTGKYHCPGYLSVITRHMAKKVLDSLAPIVEIIKNCKVVIVLPILRYVHNKCCNDANHIENFGTENLKEEVMAGLDSLREILQVWGESFFSAFTHVDCVEAITNGGDPWDATTLSGGPVWGAGDPVHLVPHAYEAATNAVLEAAESLQDQEGEPASKRQRLESVVVTVKESPRAASTKMPPPAKPTWSTGEIERPAGGKGRGGQMRGGRGPRGRGYSFKPYRGAYRGRQGGHRGGRY